MPGPLPKPAGQRLRAGQPTYSETVLPHEGRRGSPPKLPPLKDWHPATVEAWGAWWRTPQATQWDPTGRSLHRWALLYDELVSNPAAPAAIHAQLLALEDRHGMAPQSMAKLRWRIDEPAAPAAPSESGGKAAKAARLKGSA